MNEYTRDLLRRVDEINRDVQRVETWADARALRAKADKLLGAIYDDLVAFNDAVGRDDPALIEATAKAVRDAYIGAADSMRAKFGLKDAWARLHPHEPADPPPLTAPTERG